LGLILDDTGDDVHEIAYLDQGWKMATHYNTVARGVVFDRRLAGSFAVVYASDQITGLYRVAEARAGLQ